MRSLCKDALSPPRHRAAGFTLLELLVVLSILAVLLLLVPRVTAGLPGYRLRLGIGRLAETLRGLHNEAIRSGHIVALSVDRAGRRYRVGNNDWQDLSAIADRIELTRDGPLRRDADERLLFFPDGSARGGTVRFWRGTLQVAVTVDWPTGRVHNG